MSNFFGQWLGAAFRRGTGSYERTKRLARAKDVSVRRGLAGRADVKPEILYYLAEDPAPEVRRELASNAATPRHADLLLAADGDADVRVALAGKIARLTPGLSASERDDIGRLTVDVLDKLARDQVARVRQVLSETLKDVAHAPPEVIGRLARDAEHLVAAPVLEFSPVLGDEDLLEIIAGSPASGALAAISRRKVVSEPVSDAIVGVDDTDAITQLLGNPSAQIREETLDQLIERASGVGAWQTPLARRPALPPGAAVRLAQVVADNLLEDMKARHDLPRESLAAVEAELHRRLELAAKPALDPGAEEGPAQLRKRRQAVEPGLDPETEEALIEASQHRQAGKLEAADIEAALTAGNRRLVMAAFSLRAELPYWMVAKIVDNRSTKGIVALTWKAGLPASLIRVLLPKLLGISPANAPMPDDDHFPMTEDAMRWQLDFIRSTGP